MEQVNEFVVGDLEDEDHCIETSDSRQYLSIVYAPVSDRHHHPHPHPRNVELKTLHGL